MAEELIRLGGYVVQGVDNPDTLDLVLGTGVKATVNEEEKTITVSADETVLWEGTPTSSSFVITCAKDVRNFDKIEVTLSSYQRIYVDTIKIGGDIIAVGNTFVNTDGQYENSLITYQTTDYINYIWKATIHGLHKNALSSAWNSNVIITKIVGINRKPQV